MCTVKKQNAEHIRYLRTESRWDLTRIRPASRTGSGFKVYENSNSVPVPILDLDREVLKDMFSFKGICIWLHNQPI